MVDCVRGCLKRTCTGASRCDASFPPVVLLRYLVLLVHGRRFIPDHGRAPDVLFLSLDVVPSCVWLTFLACVTDPTAVDEADD